jgi:serine/threonine protein phosphatase PrpC
VRFAIFQATSVGDRRNNQDRAGYSFSRDALLMVVADGMGGHVAGERAAETAVQVLARAFAAVAKPRVADPSAFLAQAFIDAHFAVNDLVVPEGEGQGLQRQPRTTLVAALVQEGQLWSAHVGDSRLYLLRNRQVAWRTVDHSQAQLLLEQGALTAAELRHHPARNRLFASIGGEEVPRVEFGRRQVLRANDVVALCTDGLWGEYDDQELAERFAAPNLEWAVKSLVEQAVARAAGHSDNVTLLAMRWLETADSLEEGALVRTEMVEEGTVTSIFTSQIFDEGGGGVPLSDEELERTIQEINETIAKFRRNP